MWTRMTINIEGIEYTIEQKDKNSPLTITNVEDRHDWIIVGVKRGSYRMKLHVDGKGWTGENP